MHYIECPDNGELLLYLMLGRFGASLSPCTSGGEVECGQGEAEGESFKNEGTRRLQHLTEMAHTQCQRNQINKLVSEELLIFNPDKLNEFDLV